MVQEVLKPKSLWSCWKEVWLDGWVYKAEVFNIRKHSLLQGFSCFPSPSAFWALSQDNFLSLILTGFVNVLFILVTHAWACMSLSAIWNWRWHLWSLCKALHVTYTKIGLNVTAYVMWRGLVWIKLTVWYILFYLTSAYQYQVLYNWPLIHPFTYIFLTTGPPRAPWGLLSCPGSFNMWS